MRVSWCVALGGALLAGGSARGVPPHADPSHCEGTDSSRTDRPSADLYCIELLPASGIPDVRGVAELRPRRSPFGVAVTPSGSHIFDVVVTVHGLPAPGELGDYSAFVAWAVSPQLEPAIRLGELTNGRATGSVALEQFIIMVTAEARGDATQRDGRLVVRGMSASMRMQPHDAPFVLSGLVPERAEGVAPARAGAHAHHPGHEAPATEGANQGAWVPPPMHPEVVMPAALMTLRPDVGPFTPVAGVEAAPMVQSRRLVRMNDGDTLVLTAAPVRKVVNGRTVTMLGFNGQIPGPLVQVDAGATITVRFRNRTAMPTTIHWHGVRLDNRFDGVPHVTQEPVPSGGMFDYTVHFPDAGLYWYHPHLREDVLQDLGLYGNLLVRSSEPGWLGPVHREEFLMLDDLLVGDAGPIAYGEGVPTHALMGRFGNVLLVNGEPAWSLRVRRGEVVRLWLTNVASTRVFNLSFDGAARMKVVASDLGRFEREEWVENVVIAPAERYVVDVRFDESGPVRLVNQVVAIDHLFARFFPEVDTLGVVTVADGSARPALTREHERLRSWPEVTAEIERYREHFGRAPDRTLHVGVEVDSLPFPLLPLLRMESVYRHPVEWSGTMPEMDWVATGRTVRWVLRDGATGRENMDIDWRFRTGDVIMLRLVNDRGALHAMQHPVHIHGQRFVVLRVNGVPATNRVWKDTVLLPAGFTMDVLLELTNPGAWMIHCHIAEHIETGMHMIMHVAP